MLIGNQSSLLHFPCTDHPSKRIKLWPKSFSEISQTISSVLQCNWIFWLPYKREGSTNRSISAKTWSLCATNFTYLSALPCSGAVSVLFVMQWWWELWKLLSVAILWILIQCALHALLGSRGMPPPVWKLSAMRLNLEAILAITVMK